MSSLGAGLCDLCRWQRIIRNTRGSSFSLCARSKIDDRFPKYPRIPVAACPGFEHAGDAGDPARVEGEAPAG